MLCCFKPSVTKFQMFLDFVDLLRNTEINVVTSAWSGHVSTVESVDLNPTPSPILRH